MNRTPSKRNRYLVLLPAVLSLVLMVGCDRSQPDLTGAVVVPEPGTSSSTGAAPSDTLLEDG